MTSFFFLDPLFITRAFGGTGKRVSGMHGIASSSVQSAACLEIAASASFLVSFQLEGLPKQSFLAAASMYALKYCSCFSRTCTRGTFACAGKDVSWEAVCRNCKPHWIEAVP